ncbi:hypothetical protein [Lactococcus lactis]
MEILYTEITQDLTEGLLEISLEELGKKSKSLLHCAFFNVI